MNGSKLKAKKQKYRKLSPSELEKADEEGLLPGRLCRSLSAAFEALMFGVFAILGCGSRGPGSAPQPMP